MLSFTPLAILTSISLVSAAAISTRQAQFEDAPYSVSAATAIKAITCPNGIKGAAGGIVFLIHGTGSTGEQNWGSGPYVFYLPTEGVGYDVCYINLPENSTTDCQLSAEYVARGIAYLAPQSATKQVAIIGHSQGGGVDPQWALQFWPSNQALVSNYISLAGDFHGTTTEMCGQNPSSTSCTKANWQQSAGSNFMKAMTSLAPGGGGRALVPTTSIYTLDDEIVTPTYGPNPSSVLPDASNILIQDPALCGYESNLQASDHFGMAIHPVAYGVAVAALAHGSPVNMQYFSKKYCTNTFQNVLLDDPSTGFVAAIALDLVANGFANQTTSEPTLQPYVCARGFATDCGPGFEQS